MADDERTNPTEEIPEPPRGYTTADVRAQAPERKREGQSFFRRHYGKLFLAGLILVPLLVFGIWAAIALSYSYSKGDRVGYVQKFSRKGWVCRTWEGELNEALYPTQSAETWTFTVRDDEVARKVAEAQRSGRRYALRYEQHKGVPTSCFGDTEYFVVDVVPAATPTGFPIGVPGAPEAPGGTTTPPAAGAPGTTPAPTPAPPPRP
jgi:hypothetical protein